MYFNQLINLMLLWWGKEGFRVALKSSETRKA